MAGAWGSEKERKVTKDLLSRGYHSGPWGSDLLADYGGWPLCSRLRLEVAGVSLPRQVRLGESCSLAGRRGRTLVPWHFQPAQVQA